MPVHVRGRGTEASKEEMDIASCAGYNTKRKSARAFSGRGIKTITDDYI